MSDDPCMRAKRALANLCGDDRPANGRADTNGRIQRNGNIDRWLELREQINRRVEDLGLADGALPVRNGRA